MKQRPATDDDLPASAKRLALLAGSLGWEVATFYSRGTLPGRAERVSDCVTVRMWRDGGRITATYFDGSFGAGLVATRRGEQLPVTLKHAEVVRAVKGLT